MACQSAMFMILLLQAHSAVKACCSDMPGCRMPARKVLLPLLLLVLLPLLCRLHVGQQALQVGKQRVLAVALRRLAHHAAQVHAG